MAARSPIAAVLFGARERATNFVKDKDYLNDYQKAGISGAFAGFCYVNVAFLFDLLKVRAQNNRES